MFRFTIRDVLWLTVVVALLCVWHLSNRQQAADAKLRLDALDAKYNQSKANLLGLTAAAKTVGIDAVEKPDGHLMITKKGP
jgi:hypothetical protein